MELAMHCRDSDERFRLVASCGSEWTVGVGQVELFVAFSGSARQQLLTPGEKPCEEVTSIALVL